MIATHLRQRTFASLAAVGILVGALVVISSVTASAARAGVTHAVEIVDFAFGPAVLTVTVGDTVTWTNLDAVAHTATNVNGAFDSGNLEQGESHSVTFTAAGTYDYLCTPHPDMTARIVVVPAAVPTPPPPSAAPAAGGSLPDVAMERPGGHGTPIGLALLALASLAVLGRSVGRLSARCIRRRA